MPKETIISHFAPPDIRMSIDMLQNLKAASLSKDKEKFKSTAPVTLSPPTVICSGRSNLPIENYNCKVNENVAFGTDCDGMKPSNEKPKVPQTDDWNPISNSTKYFDSKGSSINMSKFVGGQAPAKLDKTNVSKLPLGKGPDSKYATTPKNVQPNTLEDDDWNEASCSNMNNLNPKVKQDETPVNLDLKNVPKSPLGKVPVSITSPKNVQYSTVDDDDDDDWDDANMNKPEDHQPVTNLSVKKIEHKAKQDSSFIEQAQCSTGAIPKAASKLKSETTDDLTESTSNQTKSARNILLENLRNRLKKKEENNLVPPQNKLNETENKSCQCTSCDNFVNCSEWCTENLEFKVPLTDDQPRSALPLFKTEPGKPVTLHTHVSSKILLHGIFIPKQIFSLEQTVIDNNVQQMLKSDNCSSAMDIQSFMWPAVQRGFNICMVAPQKTGKTLAYLPGFCSFCIEKNGSYLQVQNFEGPLCAIVCSSVSRCLKIQTLAQKLLQPNLQDVSVEILTESASCQTNCDLLIALPSVLEAQLKSGAIKLKRLCHFAIEDASNLLKNYNQSMKKIFQVLTEIQKRRPYKKNIQIVMSSEKWSLDLQIILKKLYLTPLVCFTDFLEASIYSDITFNKKIFSPAYKTLYIKDNFKRRYMTQKTVIFCKEDEIPKLSEALYFDGIESIVISNSLSEDEIFENEDMWNTLRAGHYKVLLCTDAVFKKTVDILGAQNLIHYSLPSHWVQFGKRFRCLAANLHSPLYAKERVTPESLMFVDEASENQLFLEFFEVLSRSLVSHFMLP